MPNPAVALHRYPSIVPRLRLLGANGYDSYQFGMLIRPIDISTSTFGNHERTGFGGSFVGRSALNQTRDDIVYFGVVAGSGIGNYIYGGAPAAVVANSSILTLNNNYGGYASYQHFWVPQEEGGLVSSYFTYGYSDGQRGLATDTRNTQQAAANLLAEINENVSCGFEYDYGIRRTSMGHGDDNRFMFVLYVGTATSTKTRPSSATSHNS